MPDGRLSGGRGQTAGQLNVHATTASLSDTDTYSTGMPSIESAQVTASTDGHIATVASKSSGTITLGLIADDGSAVTSTETIEITAVGSP